jgi:hypothetical protein
MASLQVSDDKITAISSFLNLCEKATINLNESLSDSLKACIIVSLKFVDKEILFKDVLPSSFIDWEYVRGFQSSSSSSSFSRVMPMLGR